MFHPTSRPATRVLTPHQHVLAQFERSLQRRGLAPPPPAETPQQALAKKIVAAGQRARGELDTAPQLDPNSTDPAEALAARICAAAAKARGESE